MSIEFTICGAAIPINSQEEEVQKFFETHNKVQRQKKTKFNGLAETHVLHIKAKQQKDDTQYIYVDVPQFENFKFLVKLNDPKMKFKSIKMHQRGQNIQKVLHSEQPAVQADVTLEQQ